MQRDGFATVPGVLGPAERREWLDTLGPVDGAGRRGLLNLPAVAGWARSPQMLDLVRPYSIREPQPVRVIYFNKSPAANWLVSWH